LTNNQSSIVNKFSPAAILIGLLIICGGCGAGGGGTEVASNADLRTSNIDTSDVLFQPDQLIAVDIQMDSADYDALRQEGRHLPQVASGCAMGYEYTHFKATVTVNDKTLEQVDIRKKGFLGSLSASRPSFKLDFDTHVPDRRLESLERMTLNNNRQDPGNTHQCMAYGLFRAAGLPAPRCNFARVTMNGEDLGIYSHVESVKNHFLRRNFSSDAGNLYEAQLADFGEYTKEHFQLKTNVEINDRSDLDAVAQALQADDDNLPGLLEQVVNLEHFIAYWAMEAITGHWDSATGNANNYYVYNDPQSGLFHYLPWGADAAMEEFHSLAPGTGPLFRYISIAARLYQIPAWRERYHARILELLDKLWDEENLNAEVDRIRDLTRTEEAHLDQVRDFIANHERRVRAAVAGEIEQQERTIVDQPTICRDENITKVRGSISSGLGYFEYVDAEGITITIPAVATPPSDDSGGAPLGNGIGINVIGALDGITRLALLTIEEPEFGALEIPFHGIASTLFLVQLGGPGGAELLGIAGEGSIRFSETPVLGEPVSFEFSADLWLGEGPNFGPLGGGQ
jgi:spore coat protein H